MSSDTQTLAVFCDFFDMTPIESAVLFAWAPLSQKDCRRLDRIRAFAGLLFEPAERWGYIWGEEGAQSPQGYLAAGPDQWEIIEADLVRRFRRSAPPEIFPGVDEEADVEGRARFLWRLLRRHLSGEESTVRNPFSGVTVQDISLRLAAALDNLAKSSDSSAVCALLAIGINAPALTIRLACARGLSSFLGFPAARHALRHTIYDESDGLRREVADLLASRAAVTDVREILRLFAADPVMEVRHAAFRALLDSGLRAGDEREVLAMSLETEGDFAARAAAEGKDLLEATSRSARVTATSDRDLLMREESVMALSSALDPDERAEVFISRFKVLESGTRPRAMRRMLRMMAQTREPLPDTVWEAAAAALDAFSVSSDEDTETLRYLLSRCSGSHVATFAVSILARPDLPSKGDLRSLLTDKLHAEMAADREVLSRLKKRMEDGALPPSIGAYVEAAAVGGQAPDIDEDASSGARAAN